MNTMTHPLTEATTRGKAGEERDSEPSGLGTCNALAERVGRDHDDALGMANLRCLADLPKYRNSHLDHVGRLAGRRAAMAFRCNVAAGCQRRGVSHARSDNRTSASKILADLARRGFRDFVTALSGKLSHADLKHEVGARLAAGGERRSGPFCGEGE